MNETIVATSLSSKVVSTKNGHEENSARHLTRVEANTVRAGDQPLPRGVDGDAADLVGVTPVEEHLDGGEGLQLARVGKLRQQIVRIVNPALGTRSGSGRGIQGKIEMRYQGTTEIARPHTHTERKRVMDGGRTLC
jgi:hypothetical protein